jgi:hypothetical protein
MPDNATTRRRLFRTLLIVAAISATSACATRLAVQDDGVVESGVFDVGAGRGNYAFLFFGFIATFVISGAIVAHNASAIGVTSTMGFVVGVGLCSAFWAIMCA